MQSQALVSRILVEKGDSKLNHLLSFLSGVLLISLLAQVAFPLPWTPVPITGQTFGVALVALLWGQKKAFSIVACYLFLGILGLPIFAGAQAGFAFGVTSGYLLGMLLSTLVVGALSDRGWTNSFVKSWFAGFLGSCVTFTCGLFILSFYIPFETLFIAGLLPFLPGDVVKTVTAATIAHRLTKLKR